ncbi:type IV pilus assembly protein PilN [Thermotomaculum hydrothermale]|uniref:Type IV pilus assembly protein PilN n=1 Tax=Thermotomaculum hydrothermale TaxID=981385 RepID=A0A7R6PMJ3_9BACT|nr:PilN domain-containing protein [Thermotomaculum hydrothermale]BBB31851.1 type IV pilus assembly protein PilN [Thermotomaculum hydrothermale]
MIQINLLSGKENLAKDFDTKVFAPKETGGGGDKSDQLIQMGAAVVFIIGLVILGIWMFMAYNGVSKAKRLLAQKRAEKKKYESLIKEQDALQKELDLLKKKTDLINNLKSRQSIPVKILEELFNRCPDSVWFESISKKGNLLDLKGQAKNSESANNYYQFLSESPIVKSLQYPILKKVEKSKIPGIVYFEFKITLKDKMDKE